MDPQPAPRKRGAQPGNKNARKHGFYATRLLPSEAKDLASVEPIDMVSEIELIRIQIRRLLLDVDQQPISLPERLELIRIVCIAARSINRLVRTQRIIQPDTALIDQLKAMAEDVREELESGAGSPDRDDDDTAEPYGFVPFKFNDEP